MRNEELNWIEIVLLVVIVWLILALCGCTTTRYVPVKETRTEYRNVIEYAHDTLIVKDSVWYKEKGDTIFVDRWHTRDRIIMTNRVDSFIVRDSIPTIVEVEKAVKYTPPFAKFCIAFFIIVLLLAIGVTAWKIYRKFVLHI